MPFRSARTGRLLIVRWSRPEEPDIAAFVQAIRSFSDELGRLPIVAAILPESADPASREVCEMMTDRAGEALAYCARGFTVVEGSSLHAIVNRLTVSAVFALPINRNQLTVCRSLDEVVSLAGAALETTRAEVHATARLLAGVDPALGQGTVSV